MSVVSPELADHTSFLSVGELCLPLYNVFIKRSVSDH